LVSLFIYGWGFYIFIIISLNALFFSFTKAKEHKKFFLSRGSDMDWNTKKGKGSALVGVLGFSVFSF
jgi:hypothetical protein